MISRLILKMVFIRFSEVSLMVCFVNGVVVSVDVVVDDFVNFIRFLGVVCICYGCEILMNCVVSLGKV